MYVAMCFGAKSAVLTRVALYLAVHGFIQAVYHVYEDARLDTKFRRSVKGTSQFGDALILNGRITAAADGTASKQTACVARSIH